MPESTKPYLDHVEFMICSTPILPINLGIASYQDKLVMSFSRIIEDRSLIQFVVDYLVKECKISIIGYGNRWEENQ
jgi:hypothetical protein